MMTLEQQFKSRVSAFLERKGMKPTTFGMKALGDPNLMRQIGRGRSPSLRTADRVLAFTVDYGGAACGKGGQAGACEGAETFGARQQAAKAGPVR